MDHKGLITVLLIFFASVCSAQVHCIVPDLVTIESPNSMQLWNGTTWGVRQLIGMTITGTEIIVSDNSTSNEGQMALSGSSNGTVQVNTNTSGSIPIKIIGKGSVIVTAHADTMEVTGGVGYFANASALTVSNTTFSTIGGFGAEVEDGQSISFEIFLMYTTGATSQGIQFRMQPDMDAGTFWYSYDFPTTTARVTGAIYNANTTVSTDSSTSGTNIAVIRGIVKSPGGPFDGLFELSAQVAAEDGSSTVTVLATSAKRTY